MQQNTTNNQAGERTQKEITYKVGTFRSAGLEAKWGKARNGAPFIFARMPQADDKSFYIVDREMWDAMKKEGVFPAFERFTMLGAFFSIKA